MSDANAAQRVWPAWLAVLKISKVTFWFVWMTLFIYGGIASAGGGVPHSFLWFLFGIAGVCLLESANCIHNELVDQEEDSINQPNRTALLKSVGERPLWVMAIGGYILCLVGIVIVALVINLRSALMMLAAVVAAPLYNWGPRFKRRPYWAEVAIGWATFFGYAAGWAWGQPDAPVPAIGWLVTFFFAITSLMKDLPDVRGDEKVNAPGVFSIRKASLRKMLLVFIYVSPYALLTGLVLAGSLPQRMLGMWILAAVGLLIMKLGEQASSLNTGILAYELAFTYVHLFMLAAFVLYTPTPVAGLAAAILFVGRGLALALGLAPRFVEPTFSWSGSLAALVKRA